jgi:hypothetical protein
MFCSIDKQKKTSKGLEIEGTCFASKGLYVGLWGNVTRKKDDKKIPNGEVRVKSVNGKKVKVIAPNLSKPVKKARLLFRVRR